MIKTGANPEGAVMAAAFLKEKGKTLLERMKAAAAKKEALAGTGTEADAAARQGYYNAIRSMAGRQRCQAQGGEEG